MGNWARDKISANYRMNLKPARVIHSENADNIRKFGHLWMCRITVAFYRNPHLGTRALSSNHHFLREKSCIKAFSSYAIPLRSPDPRGHFLSPRNRETRLGLKFGLNFSILVPASALGVPVVLVECTNFIERHGITDGIYRVSGISSNIKKLR